MNTAKLKFSTLYSHHGRSLPHEFDDVASVFNRHPRRIQDVNTGVQNTTLKLQGENILTLVSFFMICCDVFEYLFLPVHTSSCGMSELQLYPERSHRCRSGRTHCVLRRYQETQRLLQTTETQKSVSIPLSETKG